MSKKSNNRVKKEEEEGNENESRSKRKYSKDDMAHKVSDTFPTHQDFLHDANKNEKCHKDDNLYVEAYQEVLPSFQNLQTSYTFMDFEDRVASSNIMEDHYALSVWGEEEEQANMTVFKATKDLKNKKGRKGSVDLDEVDTESLSVLKNLNISGSNRMVKEELTNEEMSDIMELVETKQGPKKCLSRQPDSLQRQEVFRSNQVTKRNAQQDLMLHFEDYNRNDEGSVVANKRCLQNLIDKKYTMKKTVDKYADKNEELEEEQQEGVVTDMYKQDHLTCKQKEVEDKDRIHVKTALKNQDVWLHEQIDVDTQNILDKEVKGLFSDDEDDDKNKNEVKNEDQDDDKSDQSSN